MRATTSQIAAVYVRNGARATERLSIFSWASLGLLLAIDQLLLPMFHIGAVPYKVSYAICGLWMLDRLAQPRQDSVQSVEFRHFAIAIGCIALCGVLGDVWVSAHYPVTNYNSTLRSLLIYGLIVLSFGLGQSAYKFRFSWLQTILFVALALNFGFIVLRTAMPSWIIDLYYSDLDVGAFTEFGIHDVRGLLELARPRGLFGNPNVSGLLVNILVLFIHLGLRHRLLATPNALIGIAIVALPIPLMIVLASRGEFVVSVVLGILNYRIIFKRSSRRGRLQMLFLTSLLPIIATFALARVFGADTVEQNVDRALSVLDVVSKVSSGTQEEQANGSVARPLLTLYAVTERFGFSPLFGSGYSTTVGPPFTFETDYFHNDWFRMIATSGLIGLCVMMWIVWRYCLPLGWMAVIPFALPGMVNTFMLAIPAFMFYFFMVGVMRERTRVLAGTAS